MLFVHHMMLMIPLVSILHVLRVLLVVIAFVTAEVVLIRLAWGDWTACIVVHMPMSVIIVVVLVLILELTVLVILILVLISHVVVSFLIVLILVLHLVTTLVELLLLTIIHVLLISRGSLLRGMWASVRLLPVLLLIECVFLYIMIVLELTLPIGFVKFLGV